MTEQGINIASSLCNVNGPELCTIKNVPFSCNFGNLLACKTSHITCLFKANYIRAFMASKDAQIHEKNDFAKSAKFSPIEIYSEFPIWYPTWYSLNIFPKSIWLLGKKSQESKLNLEGESFASYFTAQIESLSNLLCTCMYVYLLNLNAYYLWCFNVHVHDVVIKRLFFTHCSLFESI